MRQAAGDGNFVRIDMEDSSTTDDTLRLYRELREAGHDNVGVVLQAHLRRTLDDIRALADLKPNVRLCKGIYVEPPAIAFTDARAMRANFVRCLDALLDVGAYVGDRDARRVAASARRCASSRERGLGRDEYELQMLLGVREERRDELVADGHRLRVYVPFGEQWYAYSLRRLQENPAMAGTIARATVGRVLGRRDVIWAKAEGCRVTLDDGRELLDLTGGFGVAALGHRNPRILEAWREQEVVHALGDLADAAVTVQLREALPRPAKLGVTGEDAVEIALRTALLATGQARHRRVRRRVPRHGPAGARGDGVRAVPRAVRAVAARARAPASVGRRIPGALPAGHGVRDRRAGAGARGLARAAGGVPATTLRRALRRGGCAARRRLDLLRARPDGRAVSGRRRRGRALHRQGARRRAPALGGALLPRRPRGAVGRSARRTSTRTPTSAARWRARLRSCARRAAGPARARRRCGRALRARRLARAGPPAGAGGSAAEALERGVLVVPAGLDGSLIQATPPLTITDAEIEEAREAPRSRAARRGETWPARGGRGRARVPPGYSSSASTCNPARASAVTTWPSRQSRSRPAGSPK